MADLKLKVGFAFFPYGGNGGTSSEVPDIRDWICETLAKIRRDDRISEVAHRNFSDTPITMTRNAAVVWAREQNVDVLVMVDSDMQPDCERDEDPLAKPFWDTSFDFIYQNWSKGPHVVCAPYCGPPPVSNVYVFQWALDENDCPNTPPRLEAYTREEASRLGGILPCAAQPTGLIMFDMRAFELTDPLKTKTQNGWFYYEWYDPFASQKASTEDVTATRDIAMAGHAVLGRDVIFCNWDAWAGHWKPKLMRKPRQIAIEHINPRFIEAVKNPQNLLHQTKRFTSPMLDQILANQRKLPPLPVLTGSDHA